MKLRWQLTLIILFSLALNSLVNILLALYQQRQLLEASHQALDQTLIASNTFNLLLASAISASALLCLGYFFARKITTPITRLTEDISEFDGNAPIITIEVKDDFEELRQLRNAFISVAGIQKSALKQSYNREQELAVTLNSIGDAVITTDANGLVVYMNPVAEQLTAWSVEAAMGMTLKSIFPLIDASTREPIDSPADKVLNGGEIVHLSNHTTLLAKDGSEHHIADSAAPIRASDNTILGMVLVFNDVTEEYRLRERAKAVHQQMQGLLNGLRTTTGILDCDGTLVFTNDTPLKAAEITITDVIGKKFWDCPWWNYSTEVQALIKIDVSQAAAGQSTSRDVLGHSPQGLFWIQLNIYPVRDESGSIIQLVAEGVRIHKRKIAEEELRESSQHLKVYRDQSPLAIIEWKYVDSNGEVTGWNRAAEKMFGYSFAEVEGKTPQFLSPPGLELKIDRHIAGLHTGSGSETLISKSLTKDGHIIYCQWYNAPLLDSEGKLIGCGSILRDITAERDAQHALLISEGEQSDILSSMREAVITVDESGTVLTFNRAAEKLFGYSASEIIHQSVAQLIPEPHSREFAQNMANYLKTGNPSKLGAGGEIQALRQNGELFPTRLSVAEFSTSKDGRRRFITTCQDLSHIKQQEEQLRRSQKMDALGKLTGGIAHDFNNMLGVVSGYAELLQGALIDQPKLAKYANEITHAGQRGAKLTQRLLAFARNDTSPATTELVDINALLHSQQHMLEKTLTPRIALVLGLGEDLWPVKVDAGELEDAILNMCINAMHAMEHSDNCQLSIRTRNEEIGVIDGLALQLSPGDYVLASITDSGCGMDKETQEQVFDPFFSTKGSEGTGLGLSQVYGFIKQSKGAVKVYSEINQGTQFVFYFPRAPISDDQQDTALITDIQPANRQASILIVDDEPALLALNKEILSQQGYHLFTAENAHDALEILDKEPINLLISDVIMPDMDGCQLLSIVHEKHPQVITQLASGFTGDHHTNEIINQHPQELLHKPYNAKALLKRVFDLLAAQENVEKA
ncbi:MAG: PAS domain S-box protein [Gammaproteobacteria bacterium]|nr:PAS domain S-box protein [Gammaproteobacteria bacterium]MBQ0841004.1 PAS domain S-box protein [Gammaproteobacteria bacterium]